MLNAAEKVCCLIKFLDEKHLASFLDNGCIHMRTLGHFRKNYEHENINVRGDKNEGLSATLKAENVVIKLNGYVIDSLDKIDIRLNDDEKLNVFCMTVITYQDFLDSPDYLISLSKDFLKFGNKAVIIGRNNVTAFYDRIRNAVESNTDLSEPEGLSYIAQKVTYVSREQHHSKLTVFNKFEEYSWQKEWRIAIKNHNPPSEVDFLELFLGDLTDICTVADTESLISKPLKFSPTA